MPGRRAEARVRNAAVAFLGNGRVTVVEGSRLLGLPAATLRGWKRRRSNRALGPNPLGRTPRGRDRETIGQVQEMVRDAGADLSVAYVRERMGWVPRAVVEEVVRSWKKEMRRRRRKNLDVLRWERAGRVWSCDWTEFGAPLDGRYRKVLAVRDLPSSETLQSLPAEKGTAWLAAAVLEDLFEVHGAPLVMKNDGGAELNGSEVEAVLDRYGVAHLRSPGYYPQYNGAIEAGIGALKAHVWYEAARNGRVGHWTCEDLEAARLKANETSRPRALKGSSPDASWQSRRPITKAERRRFLETLDEERDVRVRGHLGTPAMRSEMRADERHAIEAALQRCGYLTVVRRRVPLGVT